jgi:TP901 family phage tail tape measure protein
VNERELILAMEAVDNASPAIKQAARSILFYGESFEKAKKQAKGGFNLQGIAGALGGLGLGRAAGSLQSLAGAAGPAAVALIAVKGAMDTVGGAVEGVVAALRLMADLLRRAAELVKRVAAVVWNAVSAFARWHSRILAVGLALNALALGSTAAAMTLVTREAGGLEWQMARVRGVTGETRESIDSLALHFRDLAKSSMFTASQFAEAGFMMASAGFSGPQIRSSVNGVVKLAEALRVDLGQAAETVMAVLRAYNMEAGESTRIANVLAASNRESMATFQKLAGALQYVAPVAGTLNQRFEETVAALNLLYNTGLRGEQAGVYLRAMMLRLVNPTKQAAEMLKAHGVTLREVNPLYNDLTGIIGRLNRAQLDAAEITQLFGIRAGTAAMVLMNAGAPALRQMEQAVTGTNAAFEQAEIQLQSLTGMWKYFTASAQELALVLGTRMLDSLRNVLRMLADFINQATKTREVQRMAVLLDKLAEAIEGKLRAALDWLRANWSDIWQSAWTAFRKYVEFIAGGLGAIVAMVGEVIDSLWTHRSDLRSVWEGIVGVYAAAVAAVAEVILTLDALIGEFSTSPAWEALKRTAFAVAKVVTLAFVEMADRVIDSFAYMVAKISRTWAYLFPFMGFILGVRETAKITAGIVAAAAAINTARGGLSKLRSEVRGMNFEEFEQGVRGAGEAAGEWLGEYIPSQVRNAREAASREAEQLRKDLENALMGKPLTGAMQPAGPLGEVLQAGRQGFIDWRRGAGDFLDEVEKAAEDTADAAAGHSNASEQAAQQVQSGGRQLEAATRKAGEALSDLDIAQRWAQNVRVLEAEHRRKLERLNDQLEQGEAAVRDFAETLRARGEAAAAGVPLGRAREYAEVEQARRIIAGWRPGRVEAIIEGAGGMSREELQQAAAQSPLLRRLARAQVQRMGAGRIYDLASQRIESAWTNYAEQAKQVGNAQLSELRQQTAQQEWMVSYLGELRNNITAVEQLARERDLAYPQAAQVWFQQRQQARAQVGAARVPGGPGGYAEQKFGRVLWRIGRELMEAYQEGRMDERQEQMRGMTAGAAAGGM